MNINIIDDVLKTSQYCVCYELNINLLSLLYGYLPFGKCYNEYIPPKKFLYKKIKMIKVRSVMVPKYLDFNYINLDYIQKLNNLEVCCILMKYDCFNCKNLAFSSNLKYLQTNLNINYNIDLANCKLLMCIIAPRFRYVSMPNSFKIRSVVLPKIENYIFENRNVNFIKTRDTKFEKISKMHNLREVNFTLDMISNSLYEIKIPKSCTDFVLYFDMTKVDQIKKIVCSKKLKFLYIRNCNINVTFIFNKEIGQILIDKVINQPENLKIFINKIDNNYTLMKKLK